MIFQKRIGDTMIWYRFQFNLKRSAKAKLWKRNLIVRCNACAHWHESAWVTVTHGTRIYHMRGTLFLVYRSSHAMQCHSDAVIKTPVCASADLNLFHLSHNLSDLCIRYTLTVSFLVGGNELTRLAVFHVTNDKHPTKYKIVIRKWKIIRWEHFVLPVDCNQSTGRRMQETRYQRAAPKWPGAPKYHKRLSHCRSSRWLLCWFAYSFLIAAELEWA